SIEFYAEYLNEILQQEKIESIHLVGHSMGGYTALAFAEKFPKKTSKLCLFHSHPYEDDEEKKTGRKKAIQFIEKNGSELFVNELYNSLFAPAFYDKNPAQVAAIKKQASTYSPQSLIGSCYAMINRKDRSAIMKQLDVPVLLIIGKQDNAIPYQLSLQMCSLAPVSEIHLLDDTGHMGMLEDTERCAAIIHRFLETEF